MPAAEARALASTALALLAVNAGALGGVRLIARAGAARDHFLSMTRAAIAPAPWVRLPPNAGDEALHGGLDLPATLAAGRPVHASGLVARARGGVLVLPMAERAPVRLAAQLAALLDEGSSPGLALLALDEGIADERPSAALCDRLALHLRLDEHEDLSAPSPARVAVARQRWPQVDTSQAMVEALVEAAAALGVDSARATLQTLTAARMLAALDERGSVSAADAALAVQMVLAPRATRAPVAAAEDPAPAPPPPADTPPDPAPAPDDAASVDPAEAQQLADLLLAAARATLPPHLLDALRPAAARRRGGEAGRSGSDSASRQRGRPVGVQRGDPRQGARLALIDTLRSAAPWQRLRRADAAAVPLLPQGRLIVHRSDLRVQRRVQRRSTVTIFAIDASGSQAMHRLAEAKGAVELLLADCYARRDQVAVLGFRGTTATLLLAPTRSLVRARRELAGLPGGGGTPLALGLDAATALAGQVQAGGATALVVLLTDGRANVTRRGEGGRAQAGAEALAAARLLAARGVAALLIDTSPQPAEPARALASAMQALYLPLPHAGARAVSAAVRQARSTL